MHDFGYIPDRCPKCGSDIRAKEHYVKYVPAGEDIDWRTDEPVQGERLNCYCKCGWMWVTKTYDAQHDNPLALAN